MHKASSTVTPGTNRVSDPIDWESLRPPCHYKIWEGCKHEAAYAAKVITPGCCKHGNVVVVCENHRNHTWTHCVFCGASPGGFEILEKL